MPSIKTTRNGRFQLRVENKRLLDEPFYSTFDTHQAAQEYGDRLERLLKQGIVPAGLNDKKVQRNTWSLSHCILEYLKAGGVKHSEEMVLNTLRETLADVFTDDLNYAWCRDWVNTLKRENNLAPSTINHRVGALRRCLDWMTRDHPNILVTNPLLTLKHGFATYTSEDEKYLTEEGQKKKTHVKRNRRLHEDEEERLLALLENRQDELTFVAVALDSAMRMREIYTLTEDQISFPMKTIFLTNTKNGEDRQVPITTPAAKALKKYMTANAALIKKRGSRIFPYWTGGTTVSELDETTAEVSRIFRNVFKEAKLPDFKFHDTRHEAICRLFLRTKMSAELIAKITGHNDPRTLHRYLSLRGSDLAEKTY
ncbi:Shufflon-specific DNA recombinase [Oxalobacteraceae bacterium IMCC9480]|nr:Shufflon-specific DNA recombinase [Oxalobacteraceae bacterium IMCC9480]